MCLVVFAHQTSADYPLVVAANRDEFHARATAASRFWPGQPGLLAGQDLEQLGTWMGVTQRGRFAAVTNFRDPARTAPAPRSRGDLPLNFLTSSQSPADYLARIALEADDYAGFNLLVGNTDELWYFDNNPGEQPERLAPGIYGLSNARLNTPWPKVELGRSRLHELLERGSFDHDELARVVCDRSLADPAALELSSGENSMEHLLSAQFIIGEIYGTRSTTTLWRQAGGAAYWREQSFDGAGKLSGEQVECFEIHATGA